MIRNNYSYYKKVIFQIFNLINVKTSKNLIVFDLLKFSNLNEELQTKLIEINYKFLNPRKPFLRYKKIVNVLDKLYGKMNVSLNIANMRIKKNKKLIYFVV